MLSNQLTETRIALLVLSIATLAGTMSWSVNYLAFDADALHAGQWWRPFSAWITQLNLRHWVLNQWGVVVMAILLPKQMFWWQWSGFIVMWLVTSVALAMSDYSDYVGLSGLLYGWLIWSACLSPYYSYWVKIVFIGALTVKVFSENGWLPLPQSDWVGSFIQARVAHESHLWGLLSGYLVISIAVIVPRFRLTLVRHG